MMNDDTPDFDAAADDAVEHDRATRLMADPPGESEPHDPQREAEDAYIDAGGLNPPPEEAMPEEVEIDTYVADRVDPWPTPEEVGLDDESAMLVMPDLGGGPAPANGPFGWYPPVEVSIDTRPEVSVQVTGQQIILRARPDWVFPTHSPYSGLAYPQLADGRPDFSVKGMTWWEITHYRALAVEIARDDLAESDGWVANETPVAVSDYDGGIVVTFLVTM